MSEGYFVLPTQEELELAHHGILGQRWGIRRYQNADGSLTPAGLKRYGSKENLKAEDPGFSHSFNSYNSPWLSAHVKIGFSGLS